jgi:hypothetical protein
MFEQFAPNLGVAQVDVRQGDEGQVAVFVRGDHQRQQAQHATGALEGGKTAPTLVERVHHVRQEGVRREKARPVFGRFDACRQ